VSFDLDGSQEHTYKLTGEHMKNIYRFSALSLLFCVAMAVTLFAPVEADAQGRYASRYSKRDVNNIVVRLEQSSNTFRTNFDRAMDNSNINGTQTETRFNNIVRDFEDSVDRLRRDFDRQDSWWQSRSQVQDMVRQASPVNTMMTTLAFRRNIENQWNRLRNDVNTLADTYDLPGLNGGGWTGGNVGGGIGGGTGNAPTWAVGTFYGRSPQTGGRITLTVNRNGSVTADFGDSQSYGTINGSNLNMDGNRARVTRLNNGIRTRGTNGETIDYFRTPIGGGGGIGGGAGNAPSWAIGTFYGRNPNTGGTITMTVGRNGNVTINFGDGSLTYGTINGNILQVDNATSRITSIRNGIRTTSTIDGQVIEYFTNRPR
jgi:hypothetical protein